MRYLSLFSGIEAATVAWHPLGWQCVAVAEIEPFPCAVLAHHYPDVPNLGDVTAVTESQVAQLGPIDVLIFGSPCQDLSVAGKRKGLAGARSGLFHTAIDIIGWARRHCGLRFALWENVPGAFSSNQGADFAAVVGALAGGEFAVPPKGWGTEGAAVGEEGMVEWAVLDAQWFGVAQRRRRVFALADFRDWAHRPPVLLEPARMRGDSAPSRQARKDTAGTLAARTRGGGGLGTDFECDGGLVGHPVTMAHGQGGAEIAHNMGPTLTCNHEAPIVAHALRAEAFDARQSDVIQYGDMTGPLDTCGYSVAVAFDTAQITHPVNRSNPKPGDPCHTLRASAHAPAIAFSSKDDGADAGEIAPTLRSMGHDGSHANGGGQVAISESGSVASTLRTGGNDHADVYNSVAVAFDAYNQAAAPVTHTLRKGRSATGDEIPIAFSGKDYGADAGEIAPTLRSMGHDGSHANGGGQVAVATPMAVRRLTPRECERLQGFPDDYTLIPNRGKPAADGPRYKALGNSMAVPVIRWIGRSIAHARSINEIL